MKRLVTTMALVVLMPVVWFVVVVPDGIAANGGPLVVSGFIGGSAGIDTGGYFSEPSDIAVYTGGDKDVTNDKIFVVEGLRYDPRGLRRLVRRGYDDVGLHYDNGRVQRLDAEGNFELMWGKDVVRRGAPGDRGTGYEVCAESVTGAAGCKAAPRGTEAGEFTKPTGVAVNQATGDVYVADLGNRRVQRFGLDGDFIGAWGWGVGSGAARYDVCVRSCEAGRIGGPEGDGNSGQFNDRGRFEPTLDRRVEANGSIAVVPGSGDVLVTDTGNDRLLQFRADGRFLRAWGIGVDTGSKNFEVCTAASRCQEGGENAKTGFPHSGWLRQVAVDAAEVAYLSDLPSIEDGRVARIDVGTRPDPPKATDSLLDPLPAAERLLTGHTTLALEYEPFGRQLLASMDQSGPMVVDRVSRPAAALRPGAPSVVAEKPMTFLQSVNGMGSSYEGRIIHLAASSHLAPEDPGAGNGDCSEAGRPRPCHGLVVLSEEAPHGAVVMGAQAMDGSSATVRAVVSPAGVVRSSVQVSRDGRTWRTVSKPRYTAGTGEVAISARATHLEPRTLYRVRVRLTKRTSDVETIVPNQGFLLTAPY
jgi:DNA-binding beta-propeller fold protein YncE